ncbi:MBL fold metallo-hydrolase [Alicyclobacillus sp.]|uniref:MBL fold metallo-hydrolase n=1 Tax=Alicyclobacillus sp. TaxID=61169 RepID=UPI0025C593F6|nr:MBL fold metallo-hydrolase [Alicyclobacillus sp.]MCL6515445.1 MBL fold metallo-hydrolase [Alicyclobacillus sp.]
MKPIEMGHDVWMIDLMEQDRPCRSGAYVILDEQPTVIETGSARSHALLIEGLKELGLGPEDIRYVIVTHVHLDHAGGAGHMMQAAKHATLVVHPRGARHMVDPSRLWEGARAVYGDKLEAYFGSILPVPESRVLVREHGETLNIGRRTLTFYDSPGHAKHHFTILDPVSDALYAGDALGIRYRTCFTGWDFEWVLPSTSPVDFDPAAVHRTAEMLAQLPFRWVYHTHFGRSPKEEAIRDTVRGADAFADLIGRIFHPGIRPETVMDALRAWIRDDLIRQGHRPGDDIEVLDIDVVLDALGLIHYEQRRRQA